MALNWIPKIIYNSITIEFDIPPVRDPLNENIKGVGSSTIAADGNEQYSQDYQQEEIKLLFKKLTVAQVIALRTMYKTWALLGKSFDYYIHKSEAGFETYTLAKKDFNPKRTSPDGSDDFFYSLEIRAKRILT